MGVWSVSMSSELGAGLQSVEFYPQNVGTCSNRFETFPFLLERANRYLQANPAVQVKSCETFVVRVQGLREHRLYEAEEVASTRQERIASHRAFGCVRGLRLWLQNKPVIRSHLTDKSIAFPVLPDQLTFLDVAVPAKGRAKQRHLDDVVAAVNHALSDSLLSGQIRSVESLAVPYEGRFTDAQRSYWREGNGGAEFVEYIRLYIVPGKQPLQLVAIQDFWPAVFRKESAKRSGLYENFSEVFNRVQNCLNALPMGCRVITIQDIWRPARSSSSVPFRRASAAVHPSQGHSFLEGLRLVVCLKNPEETMVKRRPCQLKCQTFAPLVLKERQLQADETVRGDMGAWVRAEGVTVVAVAGMRKRVLVGVDSVSGREDMYQGARARSGWCGRGLEGGLAEEGKTAVVVQTYRVFFE